MSDEKNFHQISDFIEKPVDIEMLKQKIDDLLKEIDPGNQP